MSNEPANVSQFEWLVVLGGCACFAMSWGIGANDVANWYDFESFSILNHLLCRNT